jgi:hypothetical protein
MQAHLLLLRPCRCASAEAVASFWPSSFSMMAHPSGAGCVLSYLLCALGIHFCHPRWLAVPGKLDPQLGAGACFHRLWLLFVYRVEL